MMKKAMISMGVYLLLMTAGWAQIYVPVGEGMLYDAIEFASDGDEILLIPGGVYTESSQSELGTLVDKHLTIGVDGDGSEKAVVQLLTPATEESIPVFFEVGNNSSLTLRDIEFDGGLSGVPNVGSLVQFYMGEFPVETHIGTIRIMHCYVHDITSDVIKAGSADMAMYVLVDSTFIHDTVTRTTGTIVYYKYAGADYVSLTNSTFDTINSYGLRIAGPGYTFLPDNTPEVHIDRTTWYNVGTTDGREIILSERGPMLKPWYCEQWCWAVLLSPWYVSNSVFQKQILQTKTFINIKETTNDNLATISNIGFWDIGAINFRLHTVTDTLRADPQFVDPDNGDFTLASGSPMLYWGAGYTPIGDPRWTGNWTVSVDDEAGLRPYSLSLEQNYPNPFNPSTRIAFQLEQAGPVKLTVYGVTGEPLAQVVDGLLAAGEHFVEFAPENLSSGIYLYRLESSGTFLTRKMMYLK